MNSTVVRKGVLALFLTFLVPSASLAADGEKPVLRLGVVPYYQPEKMYQLWKPVVEHLTRNTPFRWELVLGETHDGLLEKLCTGELEVGFLGPIPLGKALGKCGVKPLLLSLGLDGTPTYHSVLVTADPAVNSISDLRGRKIALFEKSTAAWYLPLKMLGDAGIKRGGIHILSQPSQDRVMAAVLANQASAGGVKEAVYRRFAAERIRVLAMSDPLPQFCLCGSPSLPAAGEKALLSALLRLRPEENPADRETMKDWDPELAHGVVVPPAGFPDQVKALLVSVEPYLR